MRAYLWVLNADQCGRYITGSKVPGVDTMPEPLNLHHRRLKLWYNAFFFMCGHAVYILSLSPNVVRCSILSQRTQTIQSEIYLWSVR
jgi:hypothetical protein